MRGVWFILCVLLAAPIAHGLAVSYPYFDDNTVKLHRGETYYYPINVQNEQDGPISAKVEVTSPIARLLGQEILDIPAKTFTTTVYANITVPEDASIGQTYTVGFNVGPAPGQPQEGQVPFTVSYGRSVTVLVVEGDPPEAAQPPEVVAPASASPASWPVIPILIIAAVLVAFLIGRASRGIARRKQ